MTLEITAKRHYTAMSVASLVVSQMVCWGGAIAQEADNSVHSSKTNEVQLKPVSVTAEKVSSTDQDTPVSMTVISGDDLDRSNSGQTLDVIRHVPNMYMTKAGQHSTADMISMRGVTPFMEGEQPVGFFVDGVHYDNVDMELLDIDRIEVLRGPQSTLYGRNTEAGAINIITRDPEPYREGMASIGYGNYDEKVGSLISGGALWNPDWSYRATLRVKDSNGYFTREPGGQDDVDRTEDINARLKVRWQPTGNWDLMMSYDGQRYRDGATSIAFLDKISSNRGKVESDYIGSSDTDLHTGSLRAIYKARSFTVTSLSAVTSEENKNAYDIDFTSADMMRLYTDVAYTRATEELRFSSPDNTTGPRWVGGIYYFDQSGHNNVDVDVRNYYVQHIRTDTDTRNAAVFGQATWPLLDSVDLITGLRYDYETKNVQNNRSYSAYYPRYGSSPDMAFHAWLPKVGLEYRPLSNLMTYATYSEGYKAGGFNNLGTQGKETFRAEYTKNYEVGLKHTGFDNRTENKLSLFWIDWTDQQVDQLILTQANISNAGKSVSRGVEWEGTWQATNALVLKANAGWNDAHFVEYMYGTRNYADKRPPNSPAYTYGIAADYNFSENFYARADWLGTGGVYFDSANEHKQSSYGLLNLKTGYRYGNYEASLWVRNALDKVYVTRAFDSGLAERYAGIAGDPQTFGLTLTARW